MAEATAARIDVVAGKIPYMGTLPSAANQLFYINTMVAVNAAGQAVVPTDGDGLPVVGRANATWDNRTNGEYGGAAGAVDIEVTYDVLAVEITGTAPVAGDAVYSVDNQTVSLTQATGRGFAGIVSEVRDGQALIWLSPLNKLLNTILAATINA